jgi:hypothetical protein
MTQGNYQKTPIGSSLNRIALQTVATVAQQIGKELPCSVVSVSGSIVTVKFEITGGPPLPQVTCPIYGAQYIRLPIQPGDAGVVFSADTYLGGVSGLGGGTANLVQRGNLSSLVFFPIGNTSFFTVNGNVLTMYGPGGVTLSDQAQSTFFELTPGVITLKAGGKTWTFSSAGLTMSDGIVAETHVHLYTPGTGTPTDTGPPIA